MPVAAMARKTAVVWAVEDTAAVGVGRSSMQRWLHWYRAGVWRRGGPGKLSFLTKEQKALVVAEAAAGEFGTAAAVRDWIKEQFGAAYTVADVYTLMKRLQIRPRVPRSRHTKADPQGQTAWKKGGGSANG